MNSQMSSSIPQSFSNPNEESPIILFLQNSAKILKLSTSLFAYIHSKLPLLSWGPDSSHQNELDHWVTQRVWLPIGFEPYLAHLSVAQDRSVCCLCRIFCYLPVISCQNSPWQCIYGKFGDCLDSIFDLKSSMRQQAFVGLLRVVKMVRKFFRK